MNRTLRNSLISLAGLATLNGCAADKTHRMEGTFGKFPASVEERSGDFRRVWICDPERPDWLFVYGTDYSSNLKGIDEIVIRVPAENELVHYANPDSLEAAYKAVLKQYSEQGDSQ